MNPSVQVPAMSVGLFLGMLTCLELGYIASDAEPRLPTAVRTRVSAQEANAIGTAYLRLDVLPSSDQPELRRLFREYLEARFRAYEGSPDVNTTDRFHAQAAQLQQQIWTRAIAAARLDQTQNTTRVTLPGINEMIDVTTARGVAARTHLPGLVLMLGSSSRSSAHWPRVTRWPRGGAAA